MTIAKFRPVGNEHLENARPTSKSSSIVSTLNTPDCLNAVSNARSLPARAPVCDDAAAAPADDEPDLRITTGFLYETFLKVLIKSSSSVIDSR